MSLWEVWLVWVIKALTIVVVSLHCLHSSLFTTNCQWGEVRCGNSADSLSLSVSLCVSLSLRTNIYRSDQRHFNMSAGVVVGGRGEVPGGREQNKVYKVIIWPPTITCPLMFSPSWGWARPSWLANLSSWHDKSSQPARPVTTRWRKVCSRARPGPGVIF